MVAGLQKISQHGLGNAGLHGHHAQGGVKVGDAVQGAQVQNDAIVSHGQGAAVTPVVPGADGVHRHAVVVGNAQDGLQVMTLAHAQGARHAPCAATGVLAVSGGSRLGRQHMLGATHQTPLFQRGMYGGVHGATHTATHAATHGVVQRVYDSPPLTPVKGALKALFITWFSNPLQPASHSASAASKPCAGPK